MEGKGLVWSILGMAVVAYLYWPTAGFRSQDGVEAGLACCSISSVRDLSVDWGQDLQWPDWQALWPSYIRPEPAQRASVVYPSDIYSSELWSFGNYLWSELNWFLGIDWRLLKPVDHSGSVTKQNSGGWTDLVGPVETGEASFYGPGFHGQETAYGEIFNQNELTAAHRELPPGTIVEVERLDTGCSVVVRINDYGPCGESHPERIIDLSVAAAEELEMTDDGLAPVRVSVVD